MGFNICRRKIKGFKFQVTLSKEGHIVDWGGGERMLTFFCTVDFRSVSPSLCFLLAVNTTHPMTRIIPNKVIK